MTVEVIWFKLKDKSNLTLNIIMSQMFCGGESLSDHSDQTCCLRYRLSYYGKSNGPFRGFFSLGSTHTHSDNAAQRKTSPKDDIEDLNVITRNKYYGNHPFTACNAVSWVEKKQIRIINIFYCQEMKFFKEKTRLHKHTQKPLL